MELFKIRNPLHYSLINKPGVKHRVNNGVIKKPRSSTGTVSGFIPVRLADLPLTTEHKEKIEIRFPDGIQVVLTGPSSLSMAELLINRR